MFPSKIVFTALMLVAVCTAGEKATVQIDSLAPQFTLTDLDGNRHSLSDFRGKYVVLEWINLDCPFIKKHYESKNMPALQERYTARDVIWLSICSSAPGKQGALDNATVTARLKKHGAMQTAYLSDANGKVGRRYGARTTPHMFIIDPRGNLIYTGAIDDKPSFDQKDVASAHNYVAAALDEALQQLPVSTKVTQPYGCSVKY